MRHGSRTRESGNLDQRLWISAALNITITLVELAGGLLAGSLALLADAMHNFADAGALGVAIFARWLGRRAPTPRHTYGFKRAEILAALLNAAALIAISLLIGREALGRLFHPEAVRSSVMLVAALIALAANLASVGLLKSHSREDINVRSAFLHLLQDALASGAVVAAALLTRTGIGPYVDPVAAILVGFVVLRSAVSIVQESLHTLLEATPPDLNRRRAGSGGLRAFPGCASAPHPRLGSRARAAGPYGSHEDRRYEHWRGGVCGRRSSALLARGVENRARHLGSRGE